MEIVNQVNKIALLGTSKDTLEIVNHVNKEFKQLEELIRFKETRLLAIKTRIRELEDRLGVKSQ